MTICVAGICESSKIITVTDKMLTLSAAPVTKYEVSENNKTIQLGSQSVALFSGDVVVANQILKYASVKTSTLESVKDIADATNNTYTEYMRAVFDNWLQSRYSIDLSTFMLSQASYDPDFVKMINKALSETAFDVEILVAGIDSSGPQVYFINQLGTVIDRTSVGYGCIGSGTQHALLSLIESEYMSTVSLHEGLLALLQAKRRAEFDPGVGKLWDCALLNSKFTPLSQVQINKINKLYDDSKRKVVEMNNSVAENIKKELE